MSDTKALIVMADDDATMRMMLRAALEQDGYEVVEARNGFEALDLCSQRSPDLVLLDAMMPELDGFEACRELKSRGSHVPVLMITALEEADAVDYAFNVGAVDFITKPIHWAVLKQRVRRLLETQQAEKMRDSLTQMIVHDMKNPIGTIRGFAEYALMDTPETDPHYDYLARIYHASNNLLDMTMMILDVARMEEGKLSLQRTPNQVCEVLHNLKEAFAWVSQDRGITLNIDCDDGELNAELDWELMQRVLTNLISNAFKHSTNNSTVVVSASGSNGQLFLSVCDQGEGIAPEDQPYIFDKFKQAAHRKRGSKHDTGLGLTFCKLAVETHGGQIGVQSQVGAGAMFTITVPLNGEPI